MIVVLPAKGRISQGFNASHQAVDITNAVGTDVVAPRAGKVSFIGNVGSGTNDCGLAVQIGDPLGQERNADRLCHNSKVVVKVGQTVKAGQKIAEMGYSGFTIPDNVPEGSHSHWVMWLNGQRVDGRLYITDNDNMTYGEIPNGYSTYKKDIIFVFGFVPDYFSWKNGWPKYKDWNRATFLRQLAKSQRNLYKQCAAKEIPMDRAAVLQYLEQHLS